MTTHETPVQTTGMVLAGRVRGALRPLPDTMLTLTDRVGAELGRVRTGPGGEFQVSGLAPGSYVLIFSRPGYQPYATVAMAGTVPMEVVLEPAVSVHGVVHDRDSGQPVGAATVTAVGPGGEVNLALDTYSALSGTVTVDGQLSADLRLALYGPDGRAAATTVTDRRGAYRFDRVKAGRYVLASVTSGGRTVALAPDATTADLVMG
jgi:hypothetical protein